MLRTSSGRIPTRTTTSCSLGGTDCYGGNLPGSGNLPLNCDDGGYNYGYSFDIKYELGGLYLTAAYELHRGVNRSSDGVGSNNPIYGALLGAPGANGCATPANALSLKILDWTDYNDICAEFPGAAAVGHARVQPGVRHGQRVRVQARGPVRLHFGLTIDYIYEESEARAYRPSWSSRTSGSATATGWRSSTSSTAAPIGSRSAGPTPAHRWAIRVDSTTSTRTASVTTRPTCTPPAGGTSSTSS